MNPWEQLRTNLEQNAKIVSDLEEENRPKRKVKTTPPGVYSRKQGRTWEVRGFVDRRQVHLYYGDDYEEALRKRQEFEMEQLANYLTGSTGLRHKKAKEDL